MNDAAESAADAVVTVAETRNPFRSAQFARWWAASLVAGTGVGIQAVTVPLFIRDRVGLSARGLAISGALIAQTLPAALFALVGGVVADRVERRRILVRTYAVAAAVSSIYVLLARADTRAIWPVFPLAALVGSAGAFTNPARQSMLPLLVTRTQLQSAVILGTMGFMATLQFLGPTLAGYVVDAAGLVPAFACEVVLLTGAALIYAHIRTDQPVPSGRSVLEDLRDGVRYVRSDPKLLGLVALAAVPGIFFIGPFAVTLPIVVPDLFHQSDKYVGVLWGCFGGGVLAGSIFLTFVPLRRRGLAICLANVTGGLILLAYSLSRELRLSQAILVAWGLGASVFMNYVVTLLQENADPARMGRVMSMYSLVFFVSMPIGYGQSGLLTTWFGPQTTLFANGVAAFVIALLVLAFLRPVRSLP